MKIFKGALVFLFLNFQPAYADVYVSRIFRIQPFSQKSVSVPAGKYAAFPFKVTTSGDINVTARVLNQPFNDGSIWVCDARNFELYRKKQKNECKGANRQRDIIKFSINVNRPDTYYLIADNTFSLLETKRYQFSVVAPAIMDSAAREKILEVVTTIDKFISASFIAPKFDIKIVPCGFANAYSEGSSGNITFCSELLFELVKSRNDGAFYGTLFHELGHSLLNLWGLPNYANEETVDEIATYFLLQSGNAKLLSDYASYFEDKNSQSEADNIISRGGTHPLSVQRARNVRNNARNPQPFMDRWNRQIYPHMTNNGLKNIVRNPDIYSSPTLAKTELISRGVSW